MNRDRGMIKWTAMMLPEHVKLLRDWQKEDYFEVKPELDEQQLEQFQNTICNGIEENKQLIFMYHHNGTFHTTIGNVHYFDPLSKTIRVLDKSDNRTDIQLESIVKIELE
jgi:hypothetical protein